MNYESCITGELSGKVSSIITLALRCLYTKFRWSMSHVQPSSQSTADNVLRRLTYNRGDMDGGEYCIIRLLSLSSQVHYFSSIS